MINTNCTLPPGGRHAAKVILDYVDSSTPVTISLIHPQGRLFLPNSPLEKKKKVRTGIGGRRSSDSYLKTDKQLAPFWVQGLQT